MKIVVVSDTHGSFRELQQVINKEAPMDLMVHCGDLCESFQVLKDMTPCPVEAVAGNWDYDVSAQDERIIEMEEHRILITHGHHHHVKRDIYELLAYAGSNSCDIVMYGHTHVPKVVKEQGILVINPGSLRYPGSMNGRPSYAVLIIGKVENETNCTIDYI